MNEETTIENTTTDKLSQQDEAVQKRVRETYKEGFYTDIESDSLPPGLNEDVIRAISARKNEPDWLLEWRLAAYRKWLKMEHPNWAKLDIPPIDFQSISYFSAPKSSKNAPKSLDEVDPKLLETYDKLGVPLHERERLAGVAVDVVFDSVSVATTFKGTTGKSRCDFLLVFRSRAQSPGSGARIPGQCGAGSRQLLRRPECRGVQ